MKKKIKLYLMTLAIIILIVPLYYIVSWQMYLFNPNVAKDVKRNYLKLSSEELITKIGICNFQWFDTALKVLAERKEKKAVPRIIKLLSSPFKYARDSAIRALAEIGDERAIPPLMDIVKKGRDNPDYLDAVFALAKLGYEPIRPVVIEMLKRPDGPRNGSTKMMEYIGKKEDIPILEEMLKNIEGDDIYARLDRAGIKNAIKAIELKEK